jgi:hypothetical protein
MSPQIAVMRGLVPNIRPTTGVGASGMVDPGDKHRNDIVVACSEHHAFTWRRQTDGADMSDYPGVDWLERFKARANADSELAVIGGWFTTSFGLTFGEARYALKVEKGRIDGIVAAPRLDTRVPFGFRAPVEVWRKFLSSMPPPLFHDFFAMLMRVPEFVLEGDSLLAMQNARALHRMMNVMREVGAPDV